MPIRETLAALVRGEQLPPPVAQSLFEDILGGLLDDAQIASALSLIQFRGPTIDELLAGATVMRRHVTPIPGVAALPGSTIDTCGTGGARKTFNVSTIAAIIAAAAGRGSVNVAKHGNRGRSGRGSAEILAALGVNVDAPPPVQARCLREAGVCFCFSIHHHPAMKHAAKARLALGFPTIFNLLGPLTNPAGVSRQVMGVYDPAYVEPIAQVLARLGARRAMVVHGLDGIDEISTCGPTRIAHVENGAVRVEQFDARSLGVPRSAPEHLSANDLSDAVRIAQDTLAGAPGPALDISLLNSGAALMVGGAAGTIGEGMEKARAAVQTGQASRTLEALIRLSHESA